jgi:hypothetical protein
MLALNSLFELVKTLDIHEKRYLMGKGKKIGNGQSAYLKMLDAIYRMKEYDENELRNVFSSVSNSNKLDVKKHYLYYWILNHLNEYHGKNYHSHRNIQQVQLLLDRSLVNHAKQLISTIKGDIIKSENHLEILSLLEKELTIQKYQNEVESLSILEEIEIFSNRYRDLKYIESLQLRFRTILDNNMFSRSIQIEEEINHLFTGKIKKFNISSGSFLVNFKYNLLYYWKFGSENKWGNAYKYALNNYKLMLDNPDKIKHFTEFSMHILYNLLNAASISGKGIYTQVLKNMKELIAQQKNKRVYLDGLFYLHVSNLIHLNRNKTKRLKSKLVVEAEKFIERNKHSFSSIRLNNFYFDLAKSYYYLKDFRKSFYILNEMYQQFYSKDYTIDFNTHSRFLYCLVCYELGEYELLRSTAQSVSDFMKRNGILFQFEKKMIRFIINDLPELWEKPLEIKRKKMEKLKSDITHIFESSYEKKVLNYFDYYHWIDMQLANGH